MLTMDVFSKNNSATDNCYDSEGIAVPSNLQVLISCDFESAVSQLQDVLPGCPVRMLDRLINVMRETNHMNTRALLFIAGELKPSLVDDYYQIDNNILYHTRIEPLLMLMNLPSFNWETYWLLEKAHFHMEDREALFNLEPQKFNQALDTIKQGGQVDLFYLKLSSLKDFDNEVYCVFNDKIKYEKLLKGGRMAGQDELLKAYSFLPVCVLQALVVLKEGGAPVENLAAYEPEIHKEDFWYKAIGIRETEFEPSADFASNVLRVYQLLYGQNLLALGDDAALNLMKSVFKQNIQQKLNFSYVERRSPSQFNRKIFLRDETHQFGFIEESLPYVWERFSAIVCNVINYPMIDCEVCQRKINGADVLDVYVTRDFSLKVFDLVDKFVPFDLASFMSTMPIDRLVEYLQYFSQVGAQLGCYDPCLLIAIVVLLREEINCQNCVDLYYEHNLAFCTVYLRMVMSLLGGSSDYKELLKKGISVALLETLASSVSEHYNLASACLRLALSRIKGKIDLQQGIIGRETTDNIVIECEDGEDYACSIYSVLSNPGCLDLKLSYIARNHGKCEYSNGKLVFSKGGVNA